MTEQVLMRSPGGEVEAVEATPETLTPLMVQGWQQVKEGNDADQNAGAAIRPGVPAPD